MALTAIFLFKALILVLAIYLIIKNLKFIILIAAIIFLFFALQSYFGYNALQLLGI